MAIPMKTLCDASSHRNGQPSVHEVIADHPNRIWTSESLTTATHLSCFDTWPSSLAAEVSVPETRVCHSCDRRLEVVLRPYV